MISSQLEQLFQSLESTPVRHDWSDYEGPRFSTNKITISVGSFYERLRYAVDYQEEHMLRRAAIERIVRRMIRFTTFEDCGRSVLEELVRARYIENNTVPESFAGDIQNILEKYRRLERRIEGDSDIVWSYAAIEIEQLLFPLVINERTFTAVFQTIVSYIKPKEPELMSEEAFNLRVYIACRRVLLLETHAVLNFSLFKMMVPEWRDASTMPEDATIDAVAKRFPRVQAEILELISDPVQWKIAGRLHNESIYFSLINEIVRRFGSEAKGILSDFQQLQKVVSGILKRKYEVHKQKISQSGTSATIYVLITKIIVGLSIELPYEIFILQEINYTALGINIIFFPLLLLLMTKTVRYPGQENTEEVIQNLHAFVEDSEEEKQYVTLEPKTYVQQLGHLLFATTFFALTFGIIVYVLEQLHFNPASIFLFLLFLSIVTYMGLRIRHKSREWTFEHEDESFGGLAWFLIVLPVTRTGRWISEQLSSINIFVFFMDFILETPFKMLLGSFDSFINYVKETRRDGV